MSCHIFQRGRSTTNRIYPFQLAPIGWGVYLPGRVWMADVTGKIVEEQYSTVMARKKLLEFG